MCLGGPLASICTMTVRLSYWAYVYYTKYNKFSKDSIIPRGWTRVAPMMSFSLVNIASCSKSWTSIDARRRSRRGTSNCH